MPEPSLLPLGKQQLCLPPVAFERHPGFAGACVPTDNPRWSPQQTPSHLGPPTKVESPKRQPQQQTQQQQQQQHEQKQQKHNPKLEPKKDSVQEFADMSVSPLGPPQNPWQQQLLMQMQFLTRQSQDVIGAVRAAQEQVYNLAEQQQQQQQHQKGFHDGHLLVGDVQAVQKKLSSLEQALRQHSAMQGPAMLGGYLKEMLGTLETRLDARLLYMQQKLDSISDNIACNERQQPHQRRSWQSISQVCQAATREVTQPGCSLPRPVCAKAEDFMFVQSGDTINPGLADLDLYSELQDIMRCAEPKSANSSSDIIGLPAGNAFEERLHQKVQTTSCVLVVLNIVFMSCSLHFSMQEPFEEPEWIKIGDAIFATLFAIELIVRLKIEGRGFFMVKWNVFDATVMIFSILEVIVHFLQKFGNVSWLRLLRIIRVFRAARILQFSSWFRECQLIIASLVRGILPIFFVLLAVLFIMFVSALALAQSVQSHLKESHLKENESLLNDEGLRFYYGSLWRTMLTLFMAVSNGEQWQTLVEPLSALSDVNMHLFFFLFYIVTVKFGILNILLAVIVTFVNDMRDCDDQAELDAKSKHLQDAIAGFKQLLLNESDDGMISYKVFRKVLTGSGAQYSKLLGLQPTSMLSLFRLLDSSGCDQLSVNELMCGLMEIKVNPAHLQTASAMYESQRILYRINGLSKFLERQFAKIFMEEYAFCTSTNSGG